MTERHYRNGMPRLIGAIDRQLAIIGFCQLVIWSQFLGS